MKSSLVKDITDSLSVTEPSLKESPLLIDVLAQDLINDGWIKLDWKPEDKFYFIYEGTVARQQVYAVRGDGYIGYDNEWYHSDNMYRTKEEAEQHLPTVEDEETISIATDCIGREIQYAIWDDDRVVRVPKNYGVHREHCCVIHGCKYGDSNCPVVLKKLLQSYPCQDCSWEEIGLQDIIKEFSK